MVQRKNSACASNLRRRFANRINRTDFLGSKNKLIHDRHGGFLQLDGTRAKARIGLPVPCSIFKGAASKIAPFGGS
jgi:hypothetical protein